MSSCERKTEAEMKEASRKATEEGMRAIAAALAQKELTRKAYDADTESDTESETDCERESSRELERRIHYMKLDMSNMQVRIHELENENKVVKHLEQVNGVLVNMHRLTEISKGAEYSRMTLRECNGEWSKLNDAAVKEAEQMNGLLTTSTGFSQIDVAIVDVFEKRKDDIIKELDKLDNHITKTEICEILYYTGIAGVIWILLVLFWAYGHVLI